MVQVIDRNTRAFRTTLPRAAGGWLTGAAVIAFAVHASWALEASPPARLVIVITAHPTYREVASELEAKLTQAGHQPRRIEFPKGARTRLERKPLSPTTASGPATTSPPPQEDQTDVRTRQGLQQLAEAKASLIITVGEEATFVAIKEAPRIPVIFCMVPDALDMSFLAVGGEGSHSAGVTSDIAPGKQIEWVAELAPGARKLGIPHGPRSKHTAEAIETAAKARGIQVKLIDARKDQFGATIDALASNHCDGVMMIADVDVYNGASVQELLLWGLRSKKPIWSFAPGIVEAGVFAGQYIEERAIAQQTAELVKRVLGGARLSEIGLQYPNTVLTAVNERTAEMIDIPIPEKSLKDVTVRYGGKR